MNVYDLHFVKVFFLDLPRPFYLWEYFIGVRVTLSSSLTNLGDGLLAKMRGCISPTPVANARCFTSCSGSCSHSEKTWCHVLHVPCRRCSQTVWTRRSHFRPFTVTYNRGQFISCTRVCLARLKWRLYEPKNNYVFCFFLFKVLEISANVWTVCHWLYERIWFAFCEIFPQVLVRNLRKLKLKVVLG